MIFTNNNGNQINVIESNYNNSLDQKNGIIISVHGIGSHFQEKEEEFKFKYNLNGRFLFFSKFNLLSYAIELEGHGLSEGTRCCIYNFNDLVNDLKQLIFILKKNNPNIPIYLMGFSMGGAIIVHLCIKYPNLINGVILIAPMCGISESMKPSLPIEYILKFLLLFFPERKWIPGSDKDFVKKCSKNKDYQSYKFTDDISYKDNHRLTTAFQCVTACEYINLNSELFITPIIIFHGDSDLVTDYKISDTFYNKIESPDKKFVTLEDGYHNLLIQADENDITPQIVMNQIKLWLESRMVDDLDSCKINNNCIVDDNAIIINKKITFRRYFTLFISLILIIISIILNILIKSQI
jgi:acylglycerol lipase